MPKVVGNQCLMGVGGEGRPPGPSSGPFGACDGSLESPSPGLSSGTSGKKNGQGVVEIWGVEVLQVSENSKGIRPVVAKIWIPVPQEERRKFNAPYSNQYWAQGGPQKVPCLEVQEGLA
ncbi:hypothetical protein LXA43DRAFT_1056831 [Ganoderma leucocontextum]|nr:hypothetical protein LXA43DRAFT_1056831 [Ganoderma leucocontextum]